MATSPTSSPADLTATCAAREAVKDASRPTQQRVDGLSLGATLTRFWSAGFLVPNLPDANKAANKTTNAPFAAPSLEKAEWTASVHLTPHPHDVSVRGQMHYGREISKQRSCEGRGGRVWIYKGIGNLDREKGGGRGAKWVRRTLWVDPEVERAGSAGKQLARVGRLGTGGVETYLGGLRLD